MKAMDTQCPGGCQLGPMAAKPGEQVGLLCHACLIEIFGVVDKAQRLDLGCNNEVRPSFLSGA